jgi:hypothetical protein
MNPEENNSSQNVQNEVVDTTSATSWQIIKDKAQINHLVYALILGVTGFGTCFLAFDADENEFFLVLATASYLVSTLFAVSSIIAVFRFNPSTGLPYNIVVKILVTIIALAIGGWGAFWGGYGFLMTVGSASLPF